MREFEQFKEELLGKVYDEIPDDFRIEKLEYINIPKNNDTNNTALVIHGFDDGNLVPWITIDNFYNDYLQGSSLNEIAKDIVRMRFSSVGITMQGRHAANNINDFDAVRENICFELKGSNMNRKWMESHPFMRVHDMIVTYVIRLSEFEKVHVDNNLMNFWGIGVNELNNYAKKNTPRLRPYELKKMDELVKKLLVDDIINSGETDMEEAIQQADKIFAAAMPAEGRMPLYVLTNTDMLNGAATLLYPGVEEAVAASVGGDYYILPSSIHEFVIVPKDKAPSDITELQDMVSEINSEIVSADDKLTDTVYLYDSKERQLTVAVDAEGIIQKPDKNKKMKR